MNCLIVAATAMEISLFLDKFRQGEDLPAGIQVDVLITGIGLTASTYSLTRQSHIKRPDLMIQAGIAGCFDRQVQLGSVFAIKQEAIADQGVMEKEALKTLFDMDLVKQNQYPFTKGCLVNKNDILKKVKLKKVNGISVNGISTAKNKIAVYKERFSPVVESMEGAALHYVGLMEKIPFVQLRAISNYVGERNKKNWNMKESIINLNNELNRLLHTI